MTRWKGGEATPPKLLELGFTAFLFRIDIAPLPLEVCPSIEREKDFNPTLSDWTRIAKERGSCNCDFLPDSHSQLRKKEYQVFLSFSEAYNKTCLFDKLS